MGIANKVIKKRLLFCTNKITEIINTVDIFKKTEITAEATASMILLASVNRDMISPVRRVAKKDMGKSKTCLI